MIACAGIERDTNRRWNGLDESSRPLVCEVARGTAPGKRGLMAKGG